jgi:hypothetical protein
VLNTRIDLSVFNLAVLADQRLVIDLFDFSSVESVGLSDTDYPGGEMRYEVASSGAYPNWPAGWSEASHPAGQLAFRTFVDPAPEPTGLAVIGSGLAFGSRAVVVAMPQTSDESIQGVYFMKAC